MRAVAVEPAARNIAAIDISRNPHAISERFSPVAPRVIARFPNGDVLLAAPADTQDAFTIGGLGPVAGPALVVGRKGEFGEHAPARTTLDVLETMIKWVSVPLKIVPPEPVWPTQVRAVVIDPAERTIEEVDMQATMPAFVELLGASPVMYFRVYGGNIYGDAFERPKASWWRNGDLAFPGRVVIVGVTDDDAHFIDSTISLSGLREIIKFKDFGSEEWIRYGAGNC